MNTVNFSHLHVHTTYSILDGMADIRELIQRAKDLGQEAIAITDHGSTSGLWEAQKIGEELGVKVILGTEFYYERENDEKNGHLVVLAKNNKGLENILKLQEYAYVDNFYRRPRINFNKLVKHKEGLVILSACLASTFSQYIMNNEEQKAIDWANKFKEEFGDDFYLEIQPNSILEQFNVNRSTIAIAKKLGINFVATNDVHYILKSDSFAHEVLLALQSGKKMSDEKRFKFETNDFWLKSTEEMIDTFIGIEEKDIIESLNRTKDIVDKCNAKFIPGKYLPKFYNIPDGKTSRDVMVENLMNGAREKGHIKDVEYMKEVQKELNIIDEEGYSDYFLIVEDYVKSARRRNEVVGDGRGSAAGSKVSYLLDITRIEPSNFNLLFERFMAHGRSPDIDTDFSNQDNVFSDLQKKYGEDSVARIVAFGKMKPKAVCRKVLSAFEHKNYIINSISKMIPDLCNSMEDAYKASPELLDMKDKFPLEFSVIERLEGMISHESQHAGGIVIYPQLSKYLPIKTVGEDRSKRIVAFDMDMIEELGFYKFDVLGLDTISIIKDTLLSIEETTGEKIDLHSIDYNDENVYDMLCSGDVSGIFQLANQSEKVMQQKPRNFIDLIAINSLIRPGIGDWNEYLERREGKEYYILPERESYLKETEGIITYQEQFLLDAKVFAGWDVAYSDKHIRKNKDIKNDNELKDKFIKDSLSNGYSEDDMLNVWDDICNAVDGGYSFNKSHSASYAMTSYQTAWLKYYYPKHFYAALMSSEGSDKNGQAKIAEYIAECKQKGIKILPPDINNSSDKFEVNDDGINYRITAITHVGSSVMPHIISLRPIKSFEDFISRAEKRYAKINVVSNLIKAGCFDFDEPNRALLLEKLRKSRMTKKQLENYEEPEIIFNNKIMAEWEKEVLGLYLSTHPMEKYGFHPLDKFPNKSECLQGGEVSELSIVRDKNNNEMAFASIDTLYGIVRVVIFNSSWRDDNIKESMKVGNTVMIKGVRDGNNVLLKNVEVLK